MINERVCDLKKEKEKVAILINEREKESLMLMLTSINNSFNHASINSYDFLGVGVYPNSVSTGRMLTYFSVRPSFLSSFPPPSMSSSVFRVHFHAFIHLIIGHSFIHQSICSPSVRVSVHLSVSTPISLLVVGFVPFQIAVSGVVRNKIYSDIAIDDVSIRPGAC